jgi:hypothetical protein
LSFQKTKEPRYPINEEEWLRTVVARQIFLDFRHRGAERKLDMSMARPKMFLLLDTHPTLRRVTEEDKQLYFFRI